MRSSNHTVHPLVAAGGAPDLPHHKVYGGVNLTAGAPVGFNMAGPSHSVAFRLGRPRAYHCAVLPIVLSALFGAAIASRAAAEPGTPLSVSFGSHSLTVPWHPRPATYRFNPAVAVGTDRTLRPGNRTRVYGMLNLGFFQHHWWMTGLFLTAEVGAGLKLPLGLHSDLRLGLGYLHYFWRRQTLKLEDGVYVRATDWGRPSVMVPLTLVLGYRGDESRPLPLSPFVSVQWAAQAPFTDEAPAMTHLIVSVGVRFEIGRATPTARG